MATSGITNNRFICKLKMDDEIAEAHTVKLKGPGLTIDKAGVVAQELTYTFPAGQGLVEQDVGITGPNRGNFKLYGEITSPYYISRGVLKVKKDTINITISDPTADGWYGNLHGFRWGTSAAGSGFWTDNDLFYIYNHPGGNVTITLNNTAGLTIGASQVGPTGTFYSVAAGPAFNCSTAGQYVFRVYDDLIISDTLSRPGGLGTVTYQAFKGGVLQATKTVTRRGRIHDRNASQGGPANNVSFSITFAYATETYALPSSFSPTLYTWNVPGGSPQPLGGFSGSAPSINSDLSVTVAGMYTQTGALGVNSEFRYIAPSGQLFNMLAWLARY